MLSCGETPCKLYKCWLAPGLEAGDKKLLAIEMSFNAAKAREEGGYSGYVVRTLIQDGSSEEEAAFVASATEFTSTGSSLFQKFETWHVVLGIVLGVLLLALLLGALVKTKAFSRMRVLKKQMEELDKEE